jgi:hypothetical protein
MKPKEYIRKYNLDTSTEIPPEFIKEFAEEFVAGVSLLNEKGGFRYERFKICVEQCKQKFDGICNKSKPSKDTFEKQWKYFYATTVVKLRDAMFGEYLNERKEAHERRKKDWQESHAWERNAFEDMMKAAYEERMRGFFQYLFGNSIPNESFAILGLDNSASEDDVKSAYKKLALEHHPDKGGDEEKFKQIIIAKDKCISYISQKN